MTRVACLMPLGINGIVGGCPKKRNIAVMLSIPSYRTPIRSFFERGAISPTHINGWDPPAGGKCGMTPFLDKPRLRYFV